MTDSDSEIRNAVKAEARGLRDVEYGHINLWARVQNYDAQTGERLAQPAITAGGDRVPAGLAWDWWRVPYNAGFLELVEDTARPFLRVTDEGRAHVAAVLGEHEENQP